jgi:hypothetical protein
MHPQQRIEAFKISIHLDDDHSWRLTYNIAVSAQCSFQASTPRHNGGGGGKTTHRRLIKNGEECLLSRTACQPERKRAPICMQQQVRIEGIRVYHDQVSRLVLRWRGCRDALQSPRLRKRRRRRHMANRLKRRRRTKNRRENISLRSRYHGILHW